MARKYLNEIGLPDEAIEGLSETDPGSRGGSSKSKIGDSLTTRHGT